MPSWLEQMIGVAVVLFILVDVFLTVLYARIGAGVFSPHLARVIWWAFRGAARPFGLRAGKLLSFCGPIILVTVLIVWGPRSRSAWHSSFTRSWGARLPRPTARHRTTLPLPCTPVAGASRSWAEELRT